MDCWILSNPCPCEAKVARGFGDKPCKCKCVWTCTWLANCTDKLPLASLRRARPLQPKLATRWITLTTAAVSHSLPEKATRVAAWPQPVAAIIQATATASHSSHNRDSRHSCRMQPQQARRRITSQSRSGQYSGHGRQLAQPPHGYRHGTKPKLAMTTAAATASHRRWQPAAAQPEWCQQSSMNRV